MKVAVLSLEQHYYLTLWLFVCAVVWRDCGRRPCAFTIGDTNVGWHSQPVDEKLEQGAFDSTCRQSNAV